jgi:hypothetical protein
MADYSIEVAVPNVGPQGPQGPAGEFGELEAPEDGIIYGRKDAEWVDMTAPANLQVRRGTAAEVAAITPLEGEPVWATDTKQLVVGDGSTAGGVPIGSKVVSPYGSFLQLQYAATSFEFVQVGIQEYSDGFINLTIPANSLVIGCAYRMAENYGVFDGGSPVSFNLGWSGATGALFSSQTSASGAVNRVMLEQPVYLESETDVAFDPAEGATDLIGIIRVVVYYYKLSDVTAFSAF